MARPATTISPTRCGRRTLKTPLRATAATQHRTSPLILRSRPLLMYASPVSPGQARCSPACSSRGWQAFLTAPARGECTLRIRHLGAICPRVNKVAQLCRNHGLDTTRPLSNGGLRLSNHSKRGNAAKPRITALAVRLNKRSDQPTRFLVPQWQAMWRQNLHLLMVSGSQL